MKLSLDLTVPQEQALTEAATRLRGRPEELGAAAMRDLVAQPSGQFDEVARQVLEKHADLQEIRKSTPGCQVAPSLLARVALTM
jgi:hypothetical protein